MVINRVVSNFLMLVWRDRERILGYPVVKYDRSLKRNVLTDWVRREYGKATERAAAARVFQWSVIPILFHTLFGSRSILQSPVC